MDGYAPTIEPPPSARDRSVFDPSLALGDWRSRLRPWLPFLLTVILPTALTAAYFYLVAADQYQSEAHFIVKSNAPNSGGASSLGQALGLGGTAQSDAHSVSDYLTSHDAVAALNRTLDLVAIFRRPEADLISRLHNASPPPETLLKYYRRQVKVSVNADSGITALTVHAFRPQDAERITERLLELGEERVNTFNQRALENSLKVARTQLGEAENAVAASQGTITSFRQEGRDIDPERTSTAQISLETGLEQRLAQDRAELSSMSESVVADSPQRVAMAGEVKALEAQVNAARGRLAGSRGAMAPNLGTFESIRLRQSFAAKRYEAAAAALENARTEALKQQLFVTRVVEPNLPVKALYPERLKILATVFCGLLLAYSIGWLILAGVREHAS
jgi:capsular polysaccharide transport system permease protein